MILYYHKSGFAEATAQKTGRGHEAAAKIKNDVGEMASVAYIPRPTSWKATSFRDKIDQQKANGATATKTGGPKN